jgi:hypothetical protein
MSDKDRALFIGMYLVVCLALGAIIGEAAGIITILHGLNK